MKKLVWMSLLFVCFIHHRLSAQNNAIFKLVRAGDWAALSTHIKNEPNAIDMINADGYTPLHVLMENFVCYRSDLIYDEPDTYAASIGRSDSYRKCLIALLDAGADPEWINPKGWNALQYAVVLGKMDPVQYLLDRYDNKNITDRAGNTLLHLSLLAEPDSTRDIFWSTLIDRLRPAAINIYTPNNAGQTPIAYYFSEPRCMETYKAKSLPANAIPSATRITVVCGDERRLDMVYNFIDLKSINTKDVFGKTAIDYMNTYNDWANFSLDRYVGIATQLDAEQRAFMEKFEQQIKENMQKLQAYEASQREEDQKVANPGCLETCTTCHGFGTNGNTTYTYSCPVCFGLGHTGYDKSELQGYNNNYTYYTRQDCYSCNGNGYKTGSEPATCNTCGGSGCTR